MADKTGLSEQDYINQYQNGQAQPTQPPQQNGGNLPTYGQVILQGLMNMSPLKALMAGGSAIGNTLNSPVGADLPSVAHKALDKALNDYYTPHAQQFVQQNPQQAGMLSDLIKQSKQNSAAQDSATPTGMAQQDGAMNPNGQPAVSGMNPATGMASTPNLQPQIQPQQGGGNPGLNILAQILQGAGAAGNAPFNLQNAQAGLARQQTQNLTPGQPLSPTEQAEVGLRQQENQLKMYESQIEAHSNNLSRLSDAEKNENDSIANLSKLSPFEMNPMDKAKQIAAHVQNLQDIAGKKQSLYSNLGILAANPPKINNSGKPKAKALGSNGILHVDAQGNKAYKMPDGSWRPA